MRVEDAFAFSCLNRVFSDDRYVALRICLNFVLCNPTHLFAIIFEIPKDESHAR